MKSETGTNPLTTGGQSPLCPGTSDLNLLRYRERVIDLNARYRTALSIFVLPSKSLDGPKIAGAPIARFRQAFSETKVFSSLCLTAPENDSRQIRMMC